MGYWTWLKTQHERLAFGVKTPRAWPEVFWRKTGPEVWVFSQVQHPMIKTYYNLSLYCNTAIYCLQTISNRRMKEQISAPDIVARQNRLLLRSGCLATYIIRKLFVHSLIWHDGCWGTTMVAKEMIENALLLGTFHGRVTLPSALNIAWQNGHQHAIKLNKQPFSTPAWISAYIHCKSVGWKLCILSYTGMTKLLELMNSKVVAFF